MILVMIEVEPDELVFVLVLLELLQAESDAGTIARVAMQIRLNRSRISHRWMESWERIWRPLLIYQDPKLPYQCFANKIRFIYSGVIISWYAWENNKGVH